MAQGKSSDKRPARARYKLEGRRDKNKKARLVREGKRTKVHSSKCTCCNHPLIKKK